jgi:hypothetical protein
MSAILILYLQHNASPEDTVSNVLRNIFNNKITRCHNMESHSLKYLIVLRLRHVSLFYDSKLQVMTTER